MGVSGVASWLTRIGLASGLVIVDGAGVAAAGLGMAEGCFRAENSALKGVHAAV